MNCLHVWIIIEVITIPIKLYLSGTKEASKI